LRYFGIQASTPDVDAAEALLLHRHLDLAEAFLDPEGVVAGQARETLLLVDERLNRN